MQPRWDITVPVPAHDMKHSTSQRGPLGPPQSANPPWSQPALVSPLCLWVPGNVSSLDFSCKEREKNCFM